MRRSPIFTILLGLLSLPLTAQETFIYVSDAGNWSNPPWQILKYEEDGTFLRVFTEEQMAWPQDILFLDSVALISNLNSGRINRHHAISGDFIDIFASGIGGPTRMKVGPDSLLYVLQWTGTGTVKRYDLNGNYVDDFTDTAVVQSIGLDWDDSGNLYVSAYTPGRVEQFDIDGNWVGTFIDSGLTGPTNIWFDNDGSLLVSDYNAGDIKRYDQNGAFDSVFIGGLSQPEGVAYTSSGDLLIGNGGTGAVKSFTSEGTYIADLIPSSSGGLLRPNAVVIHEETTDDTTVSITKTHVSKGSIYPASGDRFYVKNLLAPVERVEVWDMNGQMISEGRTDTAMIWNGQDAATGAYFIVVRLENGSVLRQRIMRMEP